MNNLKKPETLREIVPEYHSKNPLVRWIFRGRLDAALALGRLGAPDVKTILDIGCGEGAFLAMVSERYPQHVYFGWDVHPAVEGLKVPRVSCARMDILAEQNIPVERFDLIFCLDVLEHFQSLDVALEKIRRMLKKDGVLVLSEPTESVFYRLGRLMLKGTYSSHGGPAAGPHYFDAAGVHRQVLQAGFRLLARKRIFFWPFDFFHITKYERGDGQVGSIPA